MIMLNDYDRAILYEIFQSECVLTTFIVKKKYEPEPNRNLETTNRNRTVSSEPWVTDISVNRGSPSVCSVLVTLVDPIL